jgi:hypothetical protein
MTIARYCLLLLLVCLAKDLMAQLPTLNSYPAASATVFIDFDGQLLYRLIVSLLRQ